MRDSVIVANRNSILGYSVGRGEATTSPLTVYKSIIQAQ